MRLSVLLSVVLLFFCSYSNAQVATNPTQTTPDLLEPDASKWSGTYGTGWWGGSQQVGPPGSDPNKLPSNTGFIWGGNANILGTTIAINQALQAAGVQVNGFEYEWKVKNGNANIFGNQPGIDDFVIEVEIYDAQGNVYATYQYDYSYSHNWTTHSGQELFTDPFLPPSYFDRVEITAQGSDSANWQGWYGPEFNVQDSSFSVIFSANPCHNNPLYDPQCQGYANALFNQQCTTNPLYDPSCPGYAAALLQQQCAANPLTDPACPGYANAYYNQQCQLNPLYDKGCTGYQQAYLNQQCSINPLYDPSCTGYASANLAQQCDYDPLYSVECPNYQKAYLEKQCELDSLYDVQCPDYQTAIELAKIVDDGKEDDPTIIDNEIDVTTTTEIEGVPNVLTLPEQQTEVVEVESGDGFEQVDDSIEGEQMAMEDDIEKEIAQLENEASEDSTAPDVISGGANQEDDIEKELAELKDSTKSENKQDAPKPKTRNEKIKILLAMKAIELTKKLEKEVSIEQNMVIQRQLLALISYVPGFDYNEKENKDGNFYPPKPTVDHAFARWFLNDPNFDVMENLQYPSLK